MSLLMRQLFRNTHRSLSSTIYKLCDAGKLLGTNVGELINHKRITSGFKYSVATGNWGMQKGASGQTGVAQILSRMTAVAAMANLRRINTPINRDGKAPKPRQLHYTCWGIICPVETPEGASCGLVRNLALMTHVRLGCISHPVSSIICDLDHPRIVRLLHCDAEVSACSTPVYVNGVLIGMVRTTEADELCVVLRKMRRNQKLPFDCSIVLFDGSLHVCMDAGCLCRPPPRRQNRRVWRGVPRRWTTCGTHCCIAVSSNTSTSRRRKGSSSHYRSTRWHTSTTHCSLIRVR